MGGIAKRRHSFGCHPSVLTRSSESIYPSAFQPTKTPQRHKVYVQDLVREYGARVWQAIHGEGGLVYVCGSSGKMPQAVREALIETFQNHGNMSREQAEAYLVTLEKSARYKQETW